MQRHLEPSELTYRQVHVKSGYEVMQLSDNIRNLADSVKNYMIHLREATIERERLGAELALATEIQDSVLPSIYPAFPERPEVDIYATMNPAREVGGDFYDFFFVDDDHLCITMADVSGKGVPAALFMMASKISLQNYALMNKSPAEILTETNAALCVKNEKKMFVTVWLGILEISTGKMTAANAGHEYPVLRHGNGRFEIYKDKHGFVIGGMAGIKYKEYEIQLNPGDKFFIYTDGVPEAMNAEHKMFGLERMTDALNEEPDAGTVKIVENVKASVERFVKDEEQFDDLTMLCLEYKGKQEGSNPAEQTSAQSGG
jgi:sigma-B regulation protein RsbU (phosphoserine phosphatase)